jgi:thioredoxin reductase (NADPH)
MSVHRHSPLLILGSGPAGYTAAVYSARANRIPLLITGLEQGGQLMTTTDVDNWPGDVEHFKGPALMDRMRRTPSASTRKSCSTTSTGRIAPAPFRLFGDNGEYTCDALIIATGASAKYLGCPPRRRFAARACPPAPPATGSSIAARRGVVGGGNTAVEEALYLANIASHVTLVHRRDKLRRRKYCRIGCSRWKGRQGQHRLESHRRRDIGDDAGVTGVRLRATATGRRRELTSTACSSPWATSPTPSCSKINSTCAAATSWSRAAARAKPPRPAFPVYSPPATWPIMSTVRP